ncbi:Ribonuclease/ribotoxin [Fusarium redolens]|uniref:Ribonuclease/ribotoxin n=1 Tax=Fusarium redolens TaxID=48865 RepID=A0A9P9FWM5_FUSRE|nr:Ribonuclease/ribotoxin [Fusarium redolens]KAH7217007.1 Ribonuclease/ribotoxin [Fusarium redolens]
MSALTFEALSQLDQLNNQRGPPSPPPSQDKWESASDCSYYSLSELVLDKWYRQIPASQVREQARQIPASPVSSQSIYPRQFYNKEELALQSSGPWKEYPFCLNKGYVCGSPGPVRIITNSSAPGDFDVVYHPGRLEKSACLAKYRSKGYQKGAVPKPLPSSEPSSPSTSSSSVGSPSLQYNPYIAAHLAQYQQAMTASYFMQSIAMPYAFPSPALAYSYFPTYGQY